MNCLRGDDAGQIFRGVGWHDACVIFVRLRSTVLVGHPNLGVQVAIRSCRASLRMSWATILRALRWGKWSVRDSCGVYLVSWSRRIRSFCRSRARALDVRTHRDIRAAATSRPSFGSIKQYFSDPARADFLVVDWHRRADHATASCGGVIQLLLHFR